MTEPGRREPARVLSFLDAASVVVGSVVGIGIFFTPAAVAARLPTPTGVLAVWAAGGAIAFLGALVFAELGAALPASGGPFVFLREAFGRLPAFLFGWVYSFVVTPGVLAVDLLVFAHYAGVAAGGLPRPGEVALALGVLATLAGANALGARPGAAIQKGATLGKVLALALVIGVGLLFGSDAAAEASPAPREGGAVGRFGAALVFVLFSYGGWQVSTFLGGEVRDPGRVLPRAILAGMCFVGFVYLAANAAFLSVLGPERMSASRAPAAEAVEAVLGAAAGRVVAAAVALSALGLANAVCLGNSRIAYAMAREARPLRFLGRLSARGVPQAAIATQALLGALLVLYATLAGEGALDPLVDGVAFPDWIVFGAVGLAAIALRGRRDLARPFRAPGFPFVPLLFVVASAFAAGSALLQHPRESLGVVAFVAAGALVFVVSRRGAASTGGGCGPP